ncbi:hypothetical protein [Streptomyces sp. NBC_00829]|uniref:hypothetical protein n=1 Tax=Streptomyces sp. NBC_00829 TaxID=2903679 RepID=UPI00386B6092|nr:hypothetical protein OG293_01305 [Streptomyces sp. NBC_00829]
MRVLRSTLASAAAIAALTTGITLAGPPESAQAAASDCTGGARGFRDHPDNASGDTAKPRSLDLGGGVVITLEKGVYVGQQIAFGKISGPTRPGDNVWMDWRADGWDDGGKPEWPVRPWLQCGPFTVQNFGQSLTTPFKRTSPDPHYQFRVCGSLASNGIVKCAGGDGAWW